MHRILIVKLSALGDVIHTLPVVKGIKDTFPDSFVGWLVGRKYKDAIEGNPYIDRIFIFERDRWGGLGNFLSRQNEIWNLVREIRTSHFDVVLDFQGLLRSGFFTLFSGAGRRIGFSHARELAWLAYTESVKIPANVSHAVDCNIFLAERLTQKPIAKDFPIAITPEDRAQAEKWLYHTPSVVLVPGARWASKCWPTRYFACLADMLISSGTMVSMVGGGCDTPLAEAILRESKFKEQIVNLIGKTSLKELAAVMAKANVVVSNDSGPMHIAAAVGTRVVAIFGPTIPAKTGPYGADNIVLRSSLPCTPCRNRQCDKKPQCMETITPENVFETIARILKKPRQA